MTQTPTGPSDPFSPENAPGVSLIVLMRLYDVGLALLHKIDPDAAAKLKDYHASGGIAGSLPTINLGKEEVAEKLPAAASVPATETFEQAQSEKDETFDDSSTRPIHTFDDFGLDTWDEGEALGVWDSEAPSNGAYESLRENLNLPPEASIYDERRERERQESQDRPEKFKKKAAYIHTRTSPKVDHITRP